MKEMEECNMGQKAPVGDSTKIFLKRYEKRCWGNSKTTCGKNRR